MNFANQIFISQNAQSDVKFADYADGFSEVNIDFWELFPLFIGEFNHYFTNNNISVSRHCCNERSNFTARTGKSTIFERKSNVFIYIWLWRCTFKVAFVLSLFAMQPASMRWIDCFFRFGYGVNISQLPIKGGVAHSDELIYLFPYPSRVADLNANDTAMAKNMVELWTSFVAYGAPQLKSNPHLVWPPMTSNWAFIISPRWKHWTVEKPFFLDHSGPYLHINKEFQIDDDFTDEFAIELWNWLS